MSTTPESANGSDLADALAEIRDLRHRLAALEARVEHAPLVATHHAVARASDVVADVVADAVGTSDSAGTGDATDATSSRRNVLRLAGAAAVGVVAAGATGARLAAADGGIAQNATVVTNTTPTRTNYTGNNGTQSGFVFQAGTTYTSNADSVSNAALAGWASTNGFNRDGVYGYTDKAGFGVFGKAVSGTGLFGTGVVGAALQGTRAALQLTVDGLPAPQTVNTASLLGMIQPDSLGNIWVCVVAGTPGTWRKLGGGNTAGAYHALTPGRVYDSRAAAPTQGTLASGATRTVSVAAQRSLTDGTVTTADFVPAGATSITCNVTVSDTQGAGFLAINPGGVTTINAAAINWSGSGQILNNGVSLTLNSNREVTVIAGGGGTTNFILDVTGYFL